MQLPLYGRSPPARRSRRCATTSFVDVPPAMIGGGEHYALEVDGDSMDRRRHPGRRHGDHRACEHGRQRGHCRALVDGEEAVTLKRLRRGGRRHRPGAGQQELRDPDLPARRVKVQGRLVGLMRQLLRESKKVEAARSPASARPGPRAPASADAPSSTLQLPPRSQTARMRTDRARGQTDGRKPGRRRRSPVVGAPG